MHLTTDVRSGHDAVGLLLAYNTLEVMHQATEDGSEIASKDLWVN
jgi:hypothetical protein